MQSVEVYLNPELTQADSDILARYLAESHHFSRHDWKALQQAVKRLGQSRVAYEGQGYTFHQFYAQLIDARYASPFLNRLYDLDDVARDWQQLWAATAREIAQWLHRVGFRDDQTDYAGYLVVHCLYRWSAFARGYAFELSTFRDMEASGIAFEPHDPRLLGDRYTQHDLTIDEWKGDVKLSFYFLPGAGTSLPLDFYISRLYDHRRKGYRTVVLMRLAVWKQINGDTLPGQLVTALSVLPRPVRVALGKQVWILSLYSEWKRRILRLQGAKA